MVSQYDVYTKSRVNTTTKVGLIVMLYEGAIRFLGLAAHSIDEKKYYEKALYINKTIKIIEELQNSLDFEQGGEIAKNLDRLYAFFVKEISAAGISNNKQAIEKVINLLTELKQSWEQLEKQQAMQTAVPKDFQGLRVSG